MTIDEIKAAMAEQGEGPGFLIPSGIREPEDLKAFFIETAPVDSFTHCQLMYTLKERKPGLFASYTDDDWVVTDVP